MNAPEDDEQPEELAPAVDPDLPRKVRRRQKDQFDQEGEWWRNALSDELGRRAIWRIFELLHPFEQRHLCTPTGFPDQHATWASLGEQLAGIALYQKLRQYDPDGVELLLAENAPQFAANPRRKADG